MPYNSIADLPADVQSALPKHGQEIYRKAYNNAWQQYSEQDDQESTAHAVAWSAVKNVYEKGANGQWRKIK